MYMLIYTHILYIKLIITDNKSFIVAHTVINVQDIWQYLCICFGVGWIYQKLNAKVL